MPCAGSETGPSIYLGIAHSEVFIGFSQIALTSIKNKYQPEFAMKYFTNNFIDKRDHMLDEIL